MAQTQAIVNGQVFDSYGNPVAQSTEFTNSGVSTGASYADILTIEAGSFSKVSITLTETGAAQSFYYQVLVSDKTGSAMPASSDASYQAVTTNVSVAASGSAYETTNSGWKWIVVQVKNNSGAATVTARARGVM